MNSQSGESDGETYGDILVGHVLATMAVINNDHTLAFINRAIGNQSPPALIGAPASVIYATASAQALLQQAIDQVLQTGEPFSYECEESAGEASGCYLNQLSAIKQDEYITSITLLVIDISAQKQAAAAQAQAQKLASLNTLVGGVAHNFNNLLAAMLIQLASGAAKLPTEHPVSQHILRTMTAAERAAELTRQLLNYAGRSSREADPLDLDELITDSLPLLAAAIPQTTQLQLALSNSIPLMLGDKRQLNQLLMNLVVNSAEAIGAQPGTINIETNIQDLTGDETHYWQWTAAPLTAGQYVKLVIHDTGCGMDAQTASKLFDPFFTTKAAGRGLGLASVLGIVRMHKGGLQVSSTLGGGATFTLLFPTPTHEPRRQSVQQSAAAYHSVSHDTAMHPSRQPLG